MCSFESIFARALDSGGFTGKRTNEKHRDIGGSRLGSVSPRIVQNDSTSMRLDGNNVDAEAENVKLAQNSIQYNTLIYKLNSELNRIKLAVREGK
jgi:flagellar basal-body rod protein FlgB